MIAKTKFWMKSEGKYQLNQITISKASNQIRSTENKGWRQRENQMETENAERKKRVRTHERKVSFELS